MCRVLVTVVVTGVTLPHPREKGDEMVLVLAPVAHGDESAGWTAFVPREPRRRGRPHRRSLWRISVIRQGQAAPTRGLAHPENKNQVCVVDQRPMGATRVLHFSFGARACWSGQVTRGLTVVIGIFTSTECSWRSSIKGIVLSSRSTPSTVILVSPIFASSVACVCVTTIW